MRVAPREALWVVAMLQRSCSSSCESAVGLVHVVDVYNVRERGIAYLAQDSETVDKTK